MKRRCTSGYIQRILHGVARADLPVEVPMHFEMVMNQKSAKGLALTLPPAPLLRAGRVIE